jgi:DNA repair protein SbcD/Mre11
MRAEFIHTADIHLGNHQYQNDERFNDFARAFHAIVEDAIRRRVAFVLVAGDIFHKRAIDALTLYQAKEAFGRLRAAGIPALVVEGNHDKAYYRDANISWLQFLSWTGELILLAPQLTEGALRFEPWSPQTMRGGYYDAGDTGIRVYGVPWYGANTATVIDRVATELRRMRDDEAADGVRYRILMLHTGVEGMVPTLHGLPTRMQYEPLRELVDYVALGHVHKSYVLDDWIFNPGSTETVSAEEWEWERGYFVVGVDPGATPPHTVVHVSNPRRSYLRWVFNVDGLASPQDLIARFEHFIERRQRPEGSVPEAQSAGDRPVVDIALRGLLAFDQSALDRKAMEAVVRRSITPLLVMIRNQTQSHEFDPAGGDPDSPDSASWQTLEQSVFRDLLLRDSRFAPTADEWAQVVAALKQHALNEDDPAAIASWLGQERSRLLEGDD